MQSVNQSKNEEERVYRDKAIRKVVAISDSGCLFYTDGGFLDEVGIVYLPGGPTDAFRAQFESIELSHVSGDWYRFSAGW